jgi:hypothetical protein
MGAVLVSSGPALGGAYDELLPEAVKGKPFVPSFKIRWEFDDNIYTTTDGEKATYGVSDEESWKLYVEPKIDLHYLTATSYLGLSYQYSLIYYTDRSGDDTDMAHDVLADIRHRFSPILEVAVRDLFRSTEEPEIAEQIVSAGGIRTVPYQRNGDYLYNQLNLGVNLHTGPRILWNWSYTNLMIDFDEGELVMDAAGTPRPGASFYYDRMVNTGAVKGLYLATPQTQIGLGGSYSDIDYDSDALLKDAEAWVLYATVNQSLAKTVVGTLSAGYENRDFSDVAVSEDSPFVDLSVAMKVGKKGNAKVGYRYALNDTQYAGYGAQEGSTFYGSLNAWLADMTSMHVNTSYEMANLDASAGVPGRSTGDADEDVWLLGLVVRQQLTRDMYLEAGYRLTDVDSDFAGSTYDRNRYYIGFGGIF